MADRTVRLIQNPFSGHRPKQRELDGALGWLQAQGWLVERHHTRYPGHARELADEAAESDIDVVLVCGGDGTINEVINGIAGSGTALAVVLGGTINLWAREMGIPADPLAAVRLLGGGERRLVDLGRANGRYFLMLFSAGTDSSAIQSVTPLAKRRWGRSAYVAAGLYDLFRRGGRQMTVTADGERFRGNTLVAIAGNTRLYGGVMLATYRARVDDGLLDLCLYGGRHWGDLAVHAVRTRFLRHDLAQNVVYRQVRHIRIESDVPVPLQLDGEPFGSTPAEIEIVPGALSVVVPPVAGNPLFSRR